MINLSLESGQFDAERKEAVLLPIFKKTGLDPVPNNDRPVSNLPFVSKVAERAVFIQANDHMTNNVLYPSLQSS